MRGGERYPFTFGWSDWTGVCSRDLTGDTVSGPSPMTNDISSPLSYQQPSTWLIHTQAAPPHRWNMSDQLGVSLLSPLSLLSSKRQRFQRDFYWVLKMQWHCAYVCLSVCVYMLIICTLVREYCTLLTVRVTWICSTVHRPNFYRCR